MVLTPDETQFDQALRKNELHRYVAGEPPYFVHTQSDNPEPQNVVQAFDTQVYPYWLRTHDAQLPDLLADALVRMLKEHPDPNRAVYLACTWLWYLRNCEDKRDKAPQGHYKDVPPMDLSDVALLLQRRASERSAELAQDTRWAGASWNSDNGLWGPIVKTTTFIRDHLKGPDAVPTPRP